MNRFETNKFLARQIEDAYKVITQLSERSALAYLQNLIVDSRPEPKAFRLIADEWQWKLAARVIPAIESVVGVRQNYHGPRFFWFTMPKGHDKTGLIGRLTNWSLAFSQRELRMYAAAGDREQASILADSMEVESRLNKWLTQRLEFRQKHVKGQHNSLLEILSSDAFSSHGIKPDLFVCDEITHWQDEGLWNALFSASEKRPDCVGIVITNAGFINTWQHKLLIEAKRCMATSGSWYVYEAPYTIASWMDKDKMNERRRMLPRLVAERLIDNKWVAIDAAAAFVDEKLVDACVELSAQTGIRLTDKPINNVRYFAGIDYGPKKDRTVLVLLHKEEKKIIIDRMEVMEGRNFGGTVPIDQVTEWCNQIHQEFGDVTFVVDPYQMEERIQDLSTRANVIRFEARGGKANYELAQNILTLVTNQNLLWPDHIGATVEANGEISTLATELKTILVTPTSYGFRISHKYNQHDDRVIAVGMAALECVKQEVRIPFQMNDYWF